MSLLGYKFEFSGLVQGVGLRPLIWQIASKMKLYGEVYNDGFGLIVILSCSLKESQIFIKLLKQNLPPLARIDTIKKSKVKTTHTNFTISASRQNPKTSPILSDFSLCKECKKEFYNKKNPRFLYPFITCTHCGPRFSIINNLPYDRKNTSMHIFKMCAFCKSEYEDPKNRRFHAQPISCEACKIPVSLKDSKGNVLACDQKAFKKSADLLKQGKILALKGMGGFHLICDASNKEAIKLLRKRKNRPLKPFALMCKDIKQAKKLAHINKSEENLLQSSIAPIVLLKAKKSPTLNLIAPNTNKIGIMLAYTPLHLLLFEYFDADLIATSANLSSESIISDEKNLLKKLNGVFDFYLDFQRTITNSSDDSIAQLIGKKAMFLRTSRGLNPYYISFKTSCKKKILALGSELKNQFVIFYDNKLVISPYIGDLKSVDCNERFFKLLNFFKETYELEFDIFLSDKHPNFNYVKNFDPKKTLKINHHYAHFCAALFEFKIKQKSLGFIFDGTGYGDDGKIWGGEIFWGDTKEYKRIGHFENFKLINSDITNLQNLALSVIWHYNLCDLARVYSEKIPQQKLENLKKIYANSTLLTSSFGRIIDALGAIVFGIEKISYEAQIGLMFEKFYDKNLKFSYKLGFKNGIIDFKELVIGALKDDKKHFSSGFFNGLADFIISFSQEFDSEVILSGGVFQNKTLLEILKRKKFKFLSPLKFPCNDSSIALGQMVHFLECNKSEQNS